MPDVITATEYLEIASTPLATPAWRITDLTPLWKAATLRGSDRLLPLAGIRQLRRREGLTTYSFPMTVWGRRDRTGTPYANLRDGLDANIEALHAAVIVPLTTTSGTRVAIWHKADGGTVSKNVTVLDFTPQAFSPAAIRGVLSLSTTGRFT